MYSVVLLLAATTSMESTSCRLFRSRGCCGPCVPTPCCGSAETTPPDGGGAVAGKLTAAEEKMLGELKTKFKDSMTPAEIKQYDEWYRSITPKERADEYKNEIKKDAGGDKKGTLSKEEEGMLKELLEKFGTKDKDGKAKFNADELKQYDAWFREQSKEDRVKEYKAEIKKGKSAQFNAPGRILVRLPADARLTVDGNATKSTSSTRVFQTPALPSSGLHFYELQATVERHGMQIQVNRLVRIQPGQTTEVNIEIPATQHVLFSQR